MAVTIAVTMEIPPDAFTSWLRERGVTPPPQAREPCWFGLGLVLVWFGLVWYWFGLVFGLVWFGWIGLVWFGLVWFLVWAAEQRSRRCGDDCDCDCVMPQMLSMVKWLKQRRGKKKKRSHGSVI